jgi:hypothetical protein
MCQDNLSRRWESLADLLFVAGLPETAQEAKKDVAADPLCWY